MITILFAFLGIVSGVLVLSLVDDGDDEFFRPLKAITFLIIACLFYFWVGVVSHDEKINEELVKRGLLEYRLDDPSDSSPTLYWTSPPRRARLGSPHAQTGEI